VDAGGAAAEPVLHPVAPPAGGPARLDPHASHERASASPRECVTSVECTRPTIDASAAISPAICSALDVPRAHARPPRSASRLQPRLRPHGRRPAPADARRRTAAPRHGRRGQRTLDPFRPPLGGAGFGSREFALELRCLRGTGIVALGLDQRGSRCLARLGGRALLGLELVDPALRCRSPLDQLG
jgi:hypothetical protein